MRNLNCETVLAVTGGVAAGPLPAGEITSITTDSRTAEPGCLFAAIPGARSDGHDHLLQAAEKGACCALCQRPVAAPVPQIIVPDTQTALRALAAWYRAQFHLPVVGVTGSVGKTTAKEMIASVLSVRYETLRTEKNFNNELGVPLTLFRLREEHEAAVVEMGISGFGEMTRLAEMVRPQIGVYTLIGDAHLEFLGSREGVLRAKGEMAPFIDPEGAVVVNGDDPLLREHDFGRRKILFGLGEHCAVRAVDVAAEGTAAMRCTALAQSRRIPLYIPAFGDHMVYAALIGVAVGVALGLTDEEIAAGVAAYETVGSRGRVIEVGTLHILDDCYNANPTSMKSALESLARLPGRHVAVLGDMRELGPVSPALHRQVGELAQDMGAALIACGPEAESMATLPGAVWYPDRQALIDALPQLIRPGDAVLVKASRAMGFEAVADALAELGRNL